MRKLAISAGSILSLLIANTVFSAEEYVPPKTSFGVPDVQGVWNYKTRTGLERPDTYEGALEVDEATMLEKMVSTPDYIAFLEATGAEAPGDHNVGGYNGFWITPGDALAQMNGKYRTSLIVDPPNGKIPWKEDGPATRRSQRSDLPMGFAESDGPEGRTLSDRCLVSFSSTAPFMSSLYNNHMQIVQSPTHVVLLAEMVHNARIVRIDQDFRDLPFEQWLGDSIGYYEGDSLVVQTRNFNPWQVDKEQMISENITLTERFTRVADDKIHYAFTIDDPDLYTQPWTSEMPMYTGEDLYEYACHEGNYAMKAILAGARRLEADARAAEQ
ncbi:MAG: hypothetical protein HOF74_12935 [Gammaproteobacteria bacterium]|jgi:hypothetical protein|nr:hypothetical protein [Gammaproteobacteria bacterium]MBT3985923.1 hypothetical protein [Gammaproteobacteria bacterium]MBT4580862.1 hypothetical protein [Gammaproteobacteria bacterium]MBT4659368.1 hypothetical protein [Gammaproteobacteria bacterium]MBT4892992.1 hypothetical protein [Gammaproteobacteria bacterium]